MGIFKKGLAIALAALMLLSICTVVAFAEGEVTSAVVRGTLPNCSWGVETDPDNTMVEKEGVYSITYSTVAAGEYQFKVVANGSDWYGKEGNNITIVVSAESDLTITFKADTKEIGFSGTNVAEKTGFEVKSASVAGTVPGTSWDTTETAKMSETETKGVYTLTLQNVAAGDYQYKFLVNEAWTDNWAAGDEAGADEALSGDLKYDSQTNFFLSLTEAKDVTFKLDLSAFDYATKLGAKYEVTLADPTTQAETTTAAPEETTTAAPEETTTAAPEETTTAAPEETTTAAPEGTTEATEGTTADPSATQATEATEATEGTTADPSASTEATEGTTAEPEETTTAAPEETTTAAPEETTTTPDKPIVAGFYVVGSEEACGAEWGWEKPYNYSDPMKQASDGTYFQVVENVKASKGNETDEGPDIFVFKVVYVNEQGGITWHPGGMGNNTKVTVAEDGSTLLFQFKLLASKPTKEGSDPEAVKVTVYGPNDTKPSFDDPKYPEEEPTTVATEATTAPATETQPETTAPVVVEKKANPVKVKATAKKVTVKKLKKAKKTLTVAAIKITKAQGKVTIAKVKKGTTSKIFKKVKVTKTKITFKKGTYKKGTYKVKIKVSAAGNANYKKGTVTKIVKIKVK